MRGVQTIEQEQLPIKEGVKGAPPLKPMPTASWAALETHASCGASCLFTVQVNLTRKHWDARGPQQRMQQLFKKQLVEAGHRATQRTHVRSLRQQHQEKLQAKERDHTRSEVGHCPSCGCPLLLMEDSHYSPAIVCTTSALAWQSLFERHAAPALCRSFSSTVRSDVSLVTRLVCSRCKLLSAMGRPKPPNIVLSLDT